MQELVHRLFFVHASGAVKCGYKYVIFLTFYCFPILLWILLEAARNNKVEFQKAFDQKIEAFLRFFRCLTSTRNIGKFNFTKTSWL